MDLNVVLLAVFVCILLLDINHGVEGGKSTLSKEEDLELEKQLNRLNKPAVKTIHTEYGDIYDCVDFYKQPAFDHPLLKNHTFHFQMKPTYSFERTRDRVSSKVNNSQFVRLKGLGCPVGTVPIRRITKEDLIRERKLALKNSDGSPDYAVVRTKASQNKYMAAGAIVGVYNPNNITTGVYSAGRLKVQNGPDSIQAGWRVDPSLYGDSRTRFFIHFETGQSSCFNTRCPGFVYVDTDFNIERVYEYGQISRKGDHGMVIVIWLNRDIVGNWWLEIDPDNVQIGFWPKNLFTGLADLASYVDWGGEVYSPPGTTPKPEMGFGTKIKGDAEYDAYMRLISVINPDGKTVDAVNTEAFTSNYLYYEVRDEGYNKGDGHWLLYGGPHDADH